MIETYRENILGLIPVLLSLYNSLRRQQKFINHQFKDMIKDIRDSNDGSISADDFYKMTRYYGYAVPAVLGEGICLLRGSRMTRKERLISTCQGIITGIYDDFIDKTKLSDQEILEITKSPQNFHATCLIEKIFVECAASITEHVKNPDLLWSMVEKVYRIQLETRKQNSEQTSVDEIREITFKKGGYSVLFYRSVYDNSLKNKEYEAFYNLGSLLQLGNDIFDLRADLIHGIHTLITKTIHFGEIVDLFYALKQQTITSFKQIDYPSKNIKAFLHYVMPVIARCEVCLHQLYKLELSSGSFLPKKHSRQEIVCDMEKGVNFFRTLKYYLRSKI